MFGLEEVLINIVGCINEWKNEWVNVWYLLGVVGMWKNFKLFFLLRDGCFILMNLLGVIFFVGVGDCFSGWVSF